MKRFFKLLALMIMTTMLLVGCSTKLANKVEATLPAPETYKLVVTNNSTYVAFFILCVGKMPLISEDDCIYSNIPLYPKIITMENDVPNETVLILEKGEYAFYAVAVDVRSGQQQYDAFSFIITEDAAIELRDPEVSVKNEG